MGTRVYFCDNGPVSLTVSACPGAGYTGILLYGSMTRRRSPFVAILLFGICVFQLGLGACGVFCVTSAQVSTRTTAGRNSSSNSTGAPTELSPIHCHEDMERQAPTKDPASRHSPHQSAPVHSNGCQPMAACAAGFMPAVASKVSVPVMSRPETAIAQPIQVLASLTFPPELPPPKA
jgi:hypothetical protein